MPFQPIEPRRLYRQIADQLRQLIQTGEFAVGSKLPAERDLATKMGVSRPSVREALIALEVEGLVEVRMGSGIYVRAIDPPASKKTVILRSCSSLGFLSSCWPATRHSSFTHSTSPGLP